jgi:hypothetical protein
VIVVHVDWGDGFESAVYCRAALFNEEQVDLRDSDDVAITTERDEWVL